MHPVATSASSQYRRRPAIRQAAAGSAPLQWGAIDAACKSPASSRRGRRQRPHRRRRWHLALICLLLGIGPFAHGREKPLWEAGLGFTALDFADYRGSDERTFYVLPVPYALYRGKILRVERDRIRGLFLESERISVQLSVSGSVPVDSSRNAARSGMPDLDPTLEIGPSLEINLYRSADARVKLELQLPARTVIATDLKHAHNVGWVFQPQLNFDLSEVLLGRKWDAGVALGPVFGDKRYHNYFYGVAPEFATARRPAYVADSGYAGIQVTGAVSRRYDRMWVGAFVRWDSVADAVFASSPLVRQEDTFTAGMAVVWRLLASQRLVPSDD